ncbi:MAG: L,D-transpeptidase family protein [Hymenobacteraceae bacterium]|nr:L,D-transpeptidase family protein [Hymenobacteraceae bacterium]
MTLLAGCDSKPKSDADALAGTASAPTDSRIPPLDSVTVQAFFTRTAPLKEHRRDAQQFYRERTGRLAWFRQGEIVPQADKLLEKVADAKSEGLDPATYRPLTMDVQKKFAALRAAKKGEADPNLIRQTDLALSALYFAYAGDFYKGTVDPHINESVDWSVKRNKIKLYRALQTILQERESTYPYYEFGSLHPEYDRLRHALSQYRALQKRGGWSTVPAIRKLEPGQTDSVAVPALRRRLLPSAGATAAVGAGTTRSASQSALYDPQLVGAVKAFQDRHGLRPDGIVGMGTVEALNVPVDARIDQLLLNMERWRWIPKKLGDRYVLVNIPEYKLHMVDGGREVFDMRVIVGKELKATPIFSDKMEHIVLAPYWGLPVSIVEEEIKPAMLRNPNFIEAEDMELLEGYGAKARPVPASSVDWANVTKENWKHTLRQRPGPKNPLGPMKFIFPNENDVYLHGTPNAWLFNKEERGFSHGCVRLEDPKKLATYLLRDQPQWTSERIDETVAAGEEKWINLKEYLPVYIVYFTSWADEAGTVHFRDDIYGHDKALEQAMFN